MSETTSTDWIRSFHDAEAGAPILVVLPHAGGSASYFHPVSASLSPQIDVRIAQYPGRQDRRHESPLDNVPELADGVLEALRGVLAEERPVVLFGHSLGATVGFEVMRRLTREGAPRPEVFVASARCAPSRHRSADIHLLPDEGIIEEVTQNLDGTSAKIFEDEEMRALLLPPIRADYRAAETYVYEESDDEEGPELDVPVVGVCGDSDRRVDPAELDSWAEHTTAGYTAHVLPGGHFYFVDEPEALLGVLRDLMGSLRTA